VRAIRHPFALLAVAAIGLLPVLAGCGGDNNDNSTTQATTSTSTSTTPAAEDHGSKDFSGEGSGEVELDDNYFNPTTIQGKPGQTLTLELKNEGKAEHNLTLTDQKIDKDVDAGEDAKVSVKVPKSGSITFFCKYHQAAGMTGKLAVASASGGSSSDDSSSGGSSSGGSSGSGSSSGGSDDSGQTTTDSSGGGGY
jgi:plastocyanin